jgi:hypothetical protein
MDNARVGLFCPLAGALFNRPQKVWFICYKRAEGQKCPSPDERTKRIDNEFYRENLTEKDTY